MQIRMQIYEYNNIEMTLLSSVRVVSNFLEFEVEVVEVSVTE